MENVTRRSVAAGLVAGAAVTAAIPAGAATADAIDQLWRAYVDLCPEARALSAAEQEANAKLPFWAQPGPSFICGDGTYCGTSVGWPLDLMVQPVGDRSQVSLCRPAPSDIQAAFEHAIAAHPAARDLARAGYRRQMRALVERLRAKDFECSRVGLPSIDAAYTANFERRRAIRERIEAAPPCANSVAALILLGAGSMAKKAYADDIPGIDVFDHIRPHLSGLVREHVEQLFQLEARSTPVDRLPYFV